MCTNISKASGKFRILQIATIDGSFATILKPQIAYLARHGHELHLVATDRGSTQSLRSEGYVVHNVSIARDIRIFADVRAVAELYKYIRANQFQIVLMDPPEYEVEGSVHLDLGTFCFDLARAGFMPPALFRFPQRWLDRLKWQFLIAYFAYLGRPLTLADLAGVRIGEEVRVRQVLTWYSNLFRYRRSVPTIYQTSLLLAECYLVSHSILELQL